MAAAAGWWTVPAIFVIAVPFLVSGFLFRLLNQHFPHAGASYHWSARVVGRRASRFQAWVLMLAYFTSIPPIIVPASTYTLSLVAPRLVTSHAAEFAVGTFWVFFALIPLLGGGRPTARITQAFLALEVGSLAILAVIGVLRWHAVAVPIHFGHLPIGGMLVTGVVAATILDGWEIDSYAAEESRRPKSDPGTAGIIGAFVALGFYAVFFPMILGETPMAALAGAPNPMAVWGARVMPSAPWLVLVPILASTAGGLWLTSFILTRALFAMGREGLIPRSFGHVSRRHVPHVAILVTLLGALAVTAMQMLFGSLSHFFSLVLSAAGFFLVLEFFLDSMTATVFLVRGHRNMGSEALSSPTHRHDTLLVAAAISTVLFGGYIVGFFIFAPRAIGGGIDLVIAVLLALGFGFTFASRKGGDQESFVGDDLRPPHEHSQRVMEMPSPKRD